MTTLGFEDYVEPLKIYLQKYREVEGEKTTTAGRQGDKDGGGGGGGAGSGSGGAGSGVVSPSLYRCKVPVSISGFAMDKRIKLFRAPSKFSIRAQQSELKGSLSVASSSVEEKGNVLRIEEWELDMYQDELAISQGIRIRRKPPSKAPLGYSGPFELRLNNDDADSLYYNILEEITWDKDEEVSRMKKLNPLEVLKKAVEDAPPTRDFVGALRMAYQRTGFPGLIAEVKKASPSRGIFKENFDPVCDALYVSFCNDIASVLELSYSE